MSIGKIGGGGRKGGAGPAKGATGKGAVGKTGGKTFGKIDRTESLVGASGQVQGGNVGGVEPLSAQAMEIARQLKGGQLKSKEEAAKKLVGEILREKLRMQSKALTDKIAAQLQDDPRLSQALERLWSKG